LSKFTCNKLKQMKGSSSSGFSNGGVSNNKPQSRREKCNEQMRGRQEDGADCMGLCTRYSGKRTYTVNAIKKIFRYCSNECWILKIFVTIGEKDVVVYLDRITHCTTAGSIKRRVFAEIKAKYGVDALAKYKSSKYKLSGNKGQPSSIPKDSHQIGIPWEGDGIEWTVNDNMDYLYLEPSVPTMGDVTLYSISTNDRKPLMLASRSRILKSTMKKLVKSINDLISMIDSKKVLPSNPSVMDAGSCTIPLQYKTILESINNQLASMKIVKSKGGRRRLLGQGQLAAASNALKNDRPEFSGIVDAAYGSCGSPKFINLEQRSTV